MIGMHIAAIAPALPSNYPSPPPSASALSPAAAYYLPTTDASMGGSVTNVDGVGALNYQRAIDIARNTEGELDPTVSEYLEHAVGDIWGRIQMQPDSYILTKDEFAVFNFYVRRFEGLPQAQEAVARYWQHAAEPTVASARS